MSTRSALRQLPGRGTSPASASTAYLFADLPVGKCLSQADMQRITGDTGNMRKFDSSKEQLWYRTPAMLKCLQSRTFPRRTSLINRLKVAEVGGFFHLGSCSACKCASDRCTGSTRLNGSYVAFVDWDTAVFVDQKTKRVVEGGQDDTGSTNVASRSDVTLEEGDYETGHAEEYDAAHTVPHVNEYNPGSPSNTRTGADSNDNDSGDGDDDDDDGNRPSKRARIKRGTSPSPPPPRRATSRSTTAAPSPTDYGVPALLKPIADRLTAHAEEKAQWAIEREHLLSELVVARASLDVERAGFAAREAAWEAGEAAWKAEKEQYEAWRKDGLRFLQR